LTAEQRRRFLADTPTVQVDEEVRKLARSIVGDAATPVEKSRRLADWVFRNLTKTYGKNASTTHQVLVNRAGDCTEHTLLFVSLARAVGLPARQVGGVGYASQGAFGGFFAWHAWAEIHDGHRWVSIDPTWNEVFVDATHVKMDEDIEDLSWVTVIGKIGFRVLEVERGAKKAPVTKGQRLWPTLKRALGW
jgi:transglutaminase-like putative cysteine protease